jgi:hypothetical protein
MNEKKLQKNNWKIYRSAERLNIEIRSERNEIKEIKTKKALQLVTVVQFSSIDCS